MMGRSRPARQPSDEADVAVADDAEIDAATVTTAGGGATTDAAAALTVDALASRSL